MLEELDLVPSETLIVALEGSRSNAGLSARSSAWQASGIRSYAAGALGVLGGFFRSFTADNPARQEIPDDQNAAAGQMPSALEMNRPRPTRRQFDDDENLLSNGNSTQYGWNPRDGEEPES